MNKKAKREALAEMLRDRQTARGLVTHAKEFHKAAELIANEIGTDDVTEGLKDSAYHNPFYYLCGHSLELSMKATLLAAGCVRHQSFWDREQHHLREALARLVDDVMRLADDAASVGWRWSVV